MPSTDVMISFDTTGSMRVCISEVRRRLDEALRKLFGSIPELRISIISHGDYCDGPSVLNGIDFTSDISKLRQFVQMTPDTSGGDSDECYEYVLKVAQGYDWQADNRILMMIGDANPHKPGYRYDGVTYNISWQEEASKLADMGVNIYAIQALGSRSSEPFYKGLAAYGNGKKLDLSQFTDAVETIISVCYHKTGGLEEYKQELVNGFKMNRNLAKLFADLDNKVEDVRYTRSDKSGLVPVPPSRFQIVHVDYTTDIKSFVESIGARFKKGRGFYQFTKSEEVQERKEVVLRNKLTGDMFTGDEARVYIGLPYGERGHIRPGFFEEYEVYIQSTSSNRKLMGHTKFLYENEMD